MIVGAYDTFVSVMIMKYGMLWIVPSGLLTINENRENWRGGLDALPDQYPLNVHRDKKKLLIASSQTL